MPEENEPLAIAGIDPTTSKCQFIGRRHPDDVIEALDLGLIIVPVTADQARRAFGEIISNLTELAS